MKIAVASGKGGTGKTLVSTNLFYTAKHAGISVTLVDCDAEEPNVGEFITGTLISSEEVKQHLPVIDINRCVFCGKCHDFCSYHAIMHLPTAGFIRVIEELCHDCGACLVACEHDAITEKDKILGLVKKISVHQHAHIVEGCTEVGVYSPVPVIKRSIGALNGETVTILDAPPGISCPFIATVSRADFIILVTEPTPFGLHDLQLSVDTLDHLGKSYGVIVNRAGLGNRDVYEWLNRKNVPLLMEIPFDREIARIYSESRILSEDKPIYLDRFFQLLENIRHLHP